MTERIEQLCRECLVANIVFVVDGHTVDWLGYGLRTAGRAERADGAYDGSHPLLSRQRSSSAVSSRSHFALTPSGMASTPLSRCKIVAFVMMGRAQKPTLRTHPNVRYRKAIPVRRPAKSPIGPMIKGTTAPPMIPVLRIPAKGPWCSETEFKARETSTGHMIEAKSPITGNAISETRAGPNSAAVRQSSAPTENPMSTLRLSKSLSRPIPMKHPAVSIPQNQETAVAPVVCGS